MHLNEHFSLMHKKNLNGINKWVATKECPQSMTRSNLQSKTFHENVNNSNRKQICHRAGVKGGKRDVFPKGKCQRVCTVIQQELVQYYDLISLPFINIMLTLHVDNV